MAMEVTYEDYSTTSTSKHHGWRVEVSRRHKERQEMDALEVEIANEYARIDCGVSVGDLTCPNATKRIVEMDRLQIGASTEPRYVTYPELQGLCDVLDVDFLNIDGPENAAMIDQGSDQGSKHALQNSSRGRRALNEKRIARMPLVRVGPDGNSSGEIDAAHATPVEAWERNNKAVVLGTGGDAVRGSTRGSNASSNNSSNVLAFPTQRPPRVVEYDVSIGVERKKELSDDELDADMVNDQGHVSDVAYRDLEQLD